MLFANPADTASLARSRPVTSDLLECPSVPVSTSDSISGAVRQSRKSGETECYRRLRTQLL